MHSETIDTLVSLGADINRRCNLGNTVLHYAIMVGDSIEKNKDIIS